MSQQPQFFETSRHGMFVVLCCAVAGAALSLSGQPLTFGAIAIAAVLYIYFASISIREPMVLVAGLLLVLEVLPPLYFDRLGETPLYPSFLLMPIVAATFLVRLPDFRFRPDSISVGLAVFLIGTLLSIPFSFWLSGEDVAVGSLSRWLLLSHAGLLYFLIRGSSSGVDSPIERRLLPLLMVGAVIAALYGIVDFLWPIPLSHPAADQFIWIEGAVLRRAQGPFYESSSFASFCGFFLVAACAALFARKERFLGISRSILILFTSILGLAVLVAFSRSTWVSVLAALIVLLALSHVVSLRRVVAVLIALAVPLFLLWLLSPELWDYLVTGRVGRLFDILEDPNAATSGRFETWVRVLSIMRDKPQYLFFGIGYKTLPVTRLFHGEIITDNGYLSLLLETGLAGLSAFLLLSVVILKVLFRIARTAREMPAFWATVIFAIWCGELVLLLAADAYTYWRNISVCCALIALTLNLADRSGTAEPSA